MADLKNMIARLFSEIEVSSESVRRDKLAVQLGPAHLSYSEPEPINLGSLFAAPPPNKEWDIIVFSTLKLRSQVERYRQDDSPTYTFSATLIDRVPRRGVAGGLCRRAFRHCRGDQRATAGRLMRGSSLN